jgi:hypothetical protein
MADHSRGFQCNRYFEGRWDCKEDISQKWVNRGKGKETEKRTKQDSSAHTSGIHLKCLRYNDNNTLCDYSESQSEQEVFLSQDILSRGSLCFLSVFCYFRFCNVSVI